MCAAFTLGTLHNILIWYGGSWGQGQERRDNCSPFWCCPWFTLAHSWLIICCGLRFHKTPFAGALNLTNFLFHFVYHLMSAVWGVFKILLKMLKMLITYLVFNTFIDLQYFVFKILLVGIFSILNTFMPKYFRSIRVRWTSSYKFILVTEEDKMFFCYRVWSCSILLLFWASLWITANCRKHWPYSWSTISTS